MKSQTEEILWIGVQEDQLIPMEIIKYAEKNRITLSQLLDYTEKDFKNVEVKNINKFLEKTKDIDVTKYQRIWSAAKGQKISLIAYNDFYFPQKLKDLYSNGTTLLYHKGQYPQFEKCVAIVGTRNCSTHASEFTRELSRKIAEKGYVVVAGLARGIDTVAHRSAISVGGKTIAVLPWMFNPYPPENRTLLSEITENGFAIGDTFFTTTGRLARGKFVHRNEIISGISDYLIAVESSITGGTTHQVEIAVKQNQTVLTLEPEQSNESAYEGFERFVELGAIPVKSVDETVEIIEKNKHKKSKSSDITLLDFSTSFTDQNKINRLHV